MIWKYNLEDYTFRYQELKYDDLRGCMPQRLSHAFIGKDEIGDTWDFNLAVL